MKKYIVTLLILTYCFSMNSQVLKHHTITESISNIKKSKNTFKSVELFKIKTDRKVERQLQTELKTFTLVDLVGSTFAEIKNKEQLFYNIPIPLSDGSFAQLNLFDASEFIGDYIVRTSSGRPYTSIKESMVLFRGEVDYKGKKGIASLTISATDVRGMFSLPDLGNFTIGKVKNSSTHVIYKDTDIKTPFEFLCGTDTSGERQNEKPKSKNVTRAEESPCISVYIEAGHELFTNEGSVADSETYIITLFNEVAALYQNENIAIDISEILVWDTDDPYDDNDLSDTLNDFQDELDDNYNGDIAHLVDMDNPGIGGIAFVDQLCDKDDAHAYTDAGTFIAAFPNYSRTVKVFAHEMGHTIGSRHTHDCEWGPDGDEQIDDCGSDLSGDVQDCFDPNNPIIPANGGTIMSYCDQPGGPGVNFNLGFGDEPGDLLRDKVDDANCLGSCFPCDITDNADFEIEPYCDNGTWKVKATTLDLDPQNHWWGLYETNTQGETSDSHTVAGPFNIQNGITAHWDWLDQSKRYYIKHGIWSDYCYQWRERRIPIEPFYVEPADYTLQDHSGNEKNTFCIGEDIWVDGTSTIGEDRYNIHAWRLINGQKQWFGSLGWIHGNMTQVNVSEGFANLNPARYFESGEYVLTIAYANPNSCEVWTPIEKEFTVECCEDFWDASFFPDISASGGVGTYTIQSANFESYENHNVLHEWYLLEDDGNGGYIPVTSSVGNFNYSSAEFGVEYTLVHKLRTPCGEICYSRTIRIGRSSQNAEITSTRDTFDCDIIDDLFPCDLKTGKLLFNCENSRVSWPRTPNVDGYVIRIYYNQGECCDTPLTNPDNTVYLNYTQNSYTIPEIDEMECFTVQLGVRCENDIIWGNPQCKTCCRIEGPPENLSYDCDTYWASFDPVAGADEYVVEVIYNDEDCFCFGEREERVRWEIGTNTRFRILPRDRYHCFSFRVGAKCEGLNTIIWSDKQCVWCFDDPPGPPRATEEMPITLKVIPNPASSKVELQVNTKDNINGIYTIYSMSGNIVGHFKGNSHSKILNVSNYPQGIYFVKFTATNYSSDVQKLIVKY